MFWIVLIIVIALFAAFLESTAGKVILGTSVTAIGFLLLAWITEIDFFIMMSKACAVIIVIAIVGAILVKLADE